MFLLSYKCKKFKKSCLVNLLHEATKHSKIVHFNIDGLQVQYSLKFKIR